MDKVMQMFNIMNGLSGNMKILLVIIIVAILLTRLTPGESKN